MTFSPMNVTFRTMTRTALCLLFVFFSTVCAWAENPATSPEPRNTWMDQHNRLLQTVRNTPEARLVFVGDSITQNWNSRGKDVWSERYAGLPAINLGISGDRTENILWRMQNGELDGLDPAVIVVMAGTNNIHRDSAVQIAEGVEAIVEEILERCPDSQILLMGVFPRSAMPDAPERVKIREVNAILSQMADEPRVDFLDIGERLLKPDGTMDRELFPDSLHPLAPGYVIWADAIAPTVDPLVGRK
jgi:lysophospholipase L1-like esterase